MKSRLFILGVVLFVALLPAHAQNTRKELVGVWQFSNLMAAGWNEVHRFFPNGKVIHHGNQMDPYKRLRKETGTWSLSGNRLKLVFTSEEVLLGGKRIAEKDLMDGDFGYEGAKIVTRALKPARVKTLTLGTINLKAKPYPVVTFGGRKMWRFDTDPANYE